MGLMEDKVETGRVRFARIVMPCILLLVGLVSGGCGESEMTVVTIDSAPESGATVLIAGGIEETTPATITGLPVGPVTLLLKREGYRDTSDQITLEMGPPQSFVIEMERLVGYISVTSTPPGADVILDDGERIGQTPIKKFPLPMGMHSYQVRLENYYPYFAEPFEVRADHQYGLNTSIQLKPQEGRVLVTSRPTGAEIWLSGSKQAGLTPKEFTLVPGEYIVDVHTAGHVMKGEKVSVTPNSDIRLELEMREGNVPAGMVFVPAGPFIRGSERAPDERPQAEIDIPDFYIDKYEVTNAEFKEVFLEHEFAQGRENFPAVGITWTQAVDYAQAVGKRLPTELEWEKAARGPKGLEYPWGNEFDSSLCTTASAGVSYPVGRGANIKGISFYDCVDMAGNVYEWTQDWYQAYPGNTIVTKDYGQVFRVLRGGSFRSERFDVRCSKRHYDKVSAVRTDYGFRCALTLQKP